MATAELSTTFDPALFSDAENAFLKDHAGTPPTVALSGAMPAGVNPAAVRTPLEQFYALAQMEEHRGQPWCGVEAIKAAIDRYEQEREKWRSLKAQGGPSCPSMYSWDAFGRPHRAGIGSDSDRIRTYIDDDGNRHKFAVDLTGSSDRAYGTFRAPWAKPTNVKDLPTALVEDQEKGTIGCPVCGFTQSYEPGSESKRNLARNRVATHLKSAKSKQDEHRHVLTHAFG